MTGRPAAQSVLVLNCGSATVKVAVIQRDAAGRVTRPLDEVRQRDTSPEALIDWLRGDNSLHGGPPSVIGHRVVHGGLLRQAALIDDEVERVIDEFSVLAPMHNPASLDMIRAARSAFPGTPQVAVFDTSFHAVMPAEASEYALPQELVDAVPLRRFGFHGISCDWAARAVAGHLGKPVAELSLIIAHLGGGASITAVRDGHSVDTSMGLTPLGGLVMGTRSGDVDPAVIPYLMHVTAMTADDVLGLLMHRSGLVGLCGDQDVRVIRRRARAGDATARKALAVYTHRIRHYVSAYLGQLPHLDALVFTGGVGEHAADVRREVVDPLGHLGLQLDPQRNARGLTADVSRIDGHLGQPAVVVVRSDEQTAIAHASWSLLDSRARPA